MGCCENCKYWLAEMENDTPICTDEDGLYFKLMVEKDDFCPDWITKEGNENDELRRGYYSL